MGLRKVPAAGSDKAVGSAEREEGEVTTPGGGRSRRRHPQAVGGEAEGPRDPESYFGAFLPETPGTARMARRA